MLASGANWYPVYTHPNLERKIHLALVKQNVTTYLPLQVVFRQWSDRVKQLQVPLFPSYLFVHIHDWERANVLKVPGVAKFILFEGHPAIISDDEISIIRKFEGSAVELESAMIAGDRVQIRQGPFAGIEGILFKKKGRARFGVRLEGLRQSLSLEIGMSLLRKL